MAELAFRYLRGRASGLLAQTARAALISTALGVAAMVVAMALMSGYTEELQSKIVGSGAIIVRPELSSLEITPAKADELRGLSGVSAARPVVYAQGSIAAVREPVALDVTIRGVDVGAPVAGGVLAPEAPVLPASKDGVPPSAVLGADLAARLAVEPGDLLALAVPHLGGERLRFRYPTVRYAGSFKTGFAEYDRRWVVLDRQWVERLSGRASLWEIGIDDSASGAAVRDRIEEALGEGFLVTDWEPHNRQLFTALLLQKVVLFFILGLIVVVSTFNVASTLVVMVRERMKEVGLLCALGFRPRQLQLLFVLCGGALGGAGTAAGVGLGAVISWWLTTYRIIRFDSDIAAIYFLSSVPFRVRLLDVAVVACFSLGVTLLACWLPAWQVSKVDPAAALRYE